MNTLRYGTPSGNIWIAKSDHFAVGAWTKDDAKARFNSSATLGQRQYSIGMPDERYQVFSGKMPMLIVGANAWVRERMPFFLLQRFDMHLLFCPNSTNEYAVAISLFNRTTPNAKPLILSSKNQSIQGALENALFGCVIETADTDNADIVEIHPKLVVWHTHWIYRCPKISLKDVLTLETCGEPK